MKYKTKEKRKVKREKSFYPEPHEHPGHTNWKKTNHAKFHLEIVQMVHEVRVVRGKNFIDFFSLFSVLY